MSYILQHTRLGFCWLDLIALVLLVAVVVLYIVNVKKMKKEQEELEKLAEAKQVIPETEDTSAKE